MKGLFLLWKMAYFFVNGNWILHKLALVSLFLFSAKVVHNFFATACFIIYQHFALDISYKFPLYLRSLVWKKQTCPPFYRMLQSFTHFVKIFDSSHGKSLFEYCNMQIGVHPGVLYFIANFKYVTKMHRKSKEQQKLRKKGYTAAQIWQCRNEFATL